MNVTQLTTGQTVQAGCRHLLRTCEFVGFSTDPDGSILYNDYRTLKSNVADPEAWYALFKDVEDDYTWTAYRWNGRWRVGSSGTDTLKLA